MKKWLFVTPALILLLFGCGSNIVIEQIDTESRPPNTGHFDIYELRKDVKRPYKKIMVIRGDYKHAASIQEENQMKRKIVAKAKESGADALIITNEGTQNIRVRDGMGGSVLYVVEYLKIEAIVYLDK